MNIYEVYQGRDNEQFKNFSIKNPNEYFIYLFLNLYVNKGV